MRNTRQIDTNIPELVIRAAIQTDSGCVRDSNEDDGCHVSPSDPESLRHRGTLTIIADGLGGHSSGEIASQMAVDIISRNYYSDSHSPPYDSLRRVIEDASVAIYEASIADPALSGMGTTIVALVILGNRAFSAHVGDSRLYRLRGGALELMTRDHSQVMEMVQQGIITVEQARMHDDRNIILRALGTGEGVNVDVSEMFTVEPGDTFLLCSDGLSDMVDDHEIESILASQTDEHRACEQLIATAKANGGHDNVTVGIVSVRAEELLPSTEVRVTRELEVL